MELSNRVDEDPMTVATYHSNINFQRLIEDCWGLLKQTSYVVFSGSSRAHPSRLVRIQPTNMVTGWYGEFWDDVMVPALTTLLTIPPPHGWGDPEGRLTIEAYLKKALLASSWANKVDWT